MTIGTSVRPRSRREFVYGGLALGTLALVGCSQPSGERTATGPQGGSTGGAPATAAQKAAMTVYRDPSCGCCEAWEKIAEDAGRSEEHTSELQSLMRISYAVFCLKKKIAIEDHCDN